MNRTDLQQLAAVRIAEAGALLQLTVPMPDGAYYLAGYAIECALKACIAKLVKEYDFPNKELAYDAYTHNLEALVRVAGLKAAIDTDLAANPLFTHHWEVVKDWSETSRYERHDLAKAQKLYNAITDKVNGVLPWIQARY